MDARERVIKAARDKKSEQIRDARRQLRKAQRFDPFNTNHLKNRLRTWREMPIKQASAYVEVLREAGVSVSEWREIVKTL